MNIEQMLKDREYTKIQEEISKMHIADIAEVINELKTPNQTIVFRLLKKDIAAEVFANLDIEQQKEIFNSIQFDELRDILDELYLDDKVDLLEELPSNAVKKILSLSTPDERRIINQFLNYKEDSAGSIMTTEYVALRGDMTAADALKHIREKGLDRETIYNCYVLSKSRELLGVVSLRDIIVAAKTELIKDIMIEDVIYVYTDTDQEEVADEFTKYNFTALPVVDTEGRMAGIITIDDIMEVIEEETTEDFHKMASMTPTEGSYLDANCFKLAKDRLPWLVILMITGTFTGGIIGNYSYILSQYLVLNAFVPMITGAGGNAGIQSSTLAVRNLAVGEIEFEDLLSVLKKELAIGFIVGIAMGIIAFTKVVLVDKVSLSIGLIVFCTLLVTIIVAKVLGAFIPLVAQKIGIDPAVMASSIITTIVDAVALLIYFEIATSLLPI